LTPECRRRRERHRSILEKLPPVRRRDECSSDSRQRIQVPHPELDIGRDRELHRFGKLARESYGTLDRAAIVRVVFFEKRDQRGQPSIAGKLRCGSRAQFRNLPYMPRNFPRRRRQRIKGALVDKTVEHDCR
jgi:hypothetical protein